MKNEKETKKKLLASARAEFIQKGYSQASLRNICKNAELTTGALYFFFQDKEELFSAIVEEPMRIIYKEMLEHYEIEKNQVSSLDQMHHDFYDDMERAVTIIHFMYQYYEEFQLVLTKSQGSKYEHIIDEFVVITEKHYRMIADQMCKA